MVKGCWVQRLFRVLLVIGPGKKWCVAPTAAMVVLKELSHLLIQRLTHDKWRLYHFF
jgi:hypothetical protein